MSVGVALGTRAMAQEHRPQIALVLGSCVALFVLLAPLRLFVALVIKGCVLFVAFWVTLALTPPPPNWLVRSRDDIDEAWHKVQNLRVVGER